LIAWEFTCTVSFKDARARSAVLKGRARSCAGRNSEATPTSHQRASGGGTRARRGAVDLRATALSSPTCRTARGCHRHPRPSGREALRVRGRVAAPSKRNSDTPAGLGVRWCRQLPDLSACASRGAAGVGLLRDHRITSDRRRSSPTS